MVYSGWRRRRQRPRERLRPGQEHERDRCLFLVIIDIYGEPREQLNLDDELFPATVVLKVVVAPSSPSPSCPASASDSTPVSPCSFSRRRFRQSLPFLGGL